MTSPTLINPYILKDFIYEEAIPENDAIKSLIHVLAISKDKAEQVLNLIQDEVKDILRKIYVAFIEAHKSLSVDTDSKLTDEIVDYFFFRLNNEVQSFLKGQQ